MNKNNRAILYGMVIGDGYIRNNRPSFSIIHGENQYEYIKHKADLLINIFNKPVNVHKFNNNGYVGYRLETSSKYFSTIRKKLYVDNTKNIAKSLEYLDEHAIALWYMDDGSLWAKKRNDVIHAYELQISIYTDSLDEINTIICWFKSNYDLTFTIKKHKNKYSIRCGTKEARKFINIVKPYIIDSMKYKITMQDIHFIKFTTTATA